MKYFLTSVAIVSAAFAIIVGFGLVKAPTNVAVGIGINNQILPYMATSTGVAMTANTNTLLLATSTTRQYAIVCNTNATTAIYLAMTGGGAATTTSGIMVPASTCYEQFPAGKIFSSAIYGISSTTNAATVSSI